MRILLLSRFSSTRAAASLRPLAASNTVTSMPEPRTLVVTVDHGHDAPF
jgi:hypothetical protein